MGGVREKKSLPPLAPEHDHDSLGFLLESVENVKHK